MIGNKIRELREENGTLLRELAATLNMDAALLSKMERGERSFRQEDIVALSSSFKCPQGQLQTLWLADKILKTLDNQEYKKEALELALKTLK